jgi:hypothetical protein
MKKIDVSTVRMGSDAEVFLKDRTGRPFPACGLIGGTKEEPLLLDEDGTAVQEDNVMLEFNTAISSTEKEWVRNLAKAQKLAYAKVPPTMYVDISPVQRFAPELLDCAQAQQFGCEPDFNAWTMEQNKRPVPEDPTMRTAAGHFHLSWAEPEDMEQRCRVIQMADIFVSLPAMRWSADRERRKMYGRAGAFRPKEYGVEHRVMDNTWLADESTIRVLWSMYMQALDAANTDFEITPKLAERIQECINSYNMEGAKGLHTELTLKIFPAMAKMEKWDGYINSYENLAAAYVSGAPTAFVAARR